jgi:hypothetical protein
MKLGKIRGGVLLALLVIVPPLWAYAGLRLSGMLEIKRLFESGKFATIQYQNPWVGKLYPVVEMEFQLRGFTHALG